MHSRILLSTTVAAFLALTPMASVLAATPVTPPAKTTTTTVTTKHWQAVKAETVEERISTLHDQLRITPSEEGRWNDVAQVMRDNAAMMERMVAHKRAKEQEPLSAKEDLRIYQKFAEAHVRGLENLRSAFDELYDFMPPAQERNADRVFSDFGHKMHGPAQ